MTERQGWEKKVVRYLKYCKVDSEKWVLKISLGYCCWLKWEREEDRKERD